MQDLQTESLWSQVSGECISGAMEGKKLIQFPAFHTTFEVFARLFPNGLLLKKPEKGLSGSPYDSYFADKTKLGIFGRADNFQKLNGKDKVFGLRFGEKEIAVSEAYLHKHGYALIENESSPVVITYGSDGMTAVAFVLTEFNQADLKSLKIDSNRISLPNRQVAWDGRTGKTLSGSAEYLRMVPVITAYWFAWAGFFPDTELIK